ERPPEKRKVGGSTPPLPTPDDQPKGPKPITVPGLLTATVTATASAERIPQLPKRRPLLLNGRMCVNRHGHLDIAVTDDVPHDVRRNTEVQEQRNAGVPHVMKAHPVQTGGRADTAPTPA